MKVKYIVKGSATIYDRDSNGELLWDTEGKSISVRVVDKLKQFNGKALLEQLEQLAKHNQGVSKEKLQFKHLVELNMIKKRNHTIEITTQILRYGTMYIVEYKKDVTKFYSKVDKL